MLKLAVLLLAVMVSILLPSSFAAGNNTGVTAVIGGGTGDDLTIDITVADPEGVARVTISSESASGEKVRITDTLSPTCPTSVTYTINPRDSADETYDVGVLDCDEPGQPSLTHINSDGSSEPTDYEIGPVVGAPALPMNKLELLLPFVGLASVIVAGAASLLYLTRSKHEARS